MLPPLSPNLGADLSGKAVLSAALISILYFFPFPYYKRHAIKNQIRVMHVFVILPIHFFVDNCRLLPQIPAFSLIFVIHFAIAYGFRGQPVCIFFSCG